jgi:GNAT superfamily N-acetyltransferase
MIRLIRTNSENKHFQELVKALDLDLRIRDGEDHTFFAQFNKIDMIKYVVVAYENEIAIACGAIKEYEKKVMEVKRMYVKEEKRGKGVASIVLQELEKWCIELNYEKCILETGLAQPEAIRLYTKNNYQRIPNFGQYEQVVTSVCFEKLLLS